jgi:hypothetical protein
MSTFNEQVAQDLGAILSDLPGDSVTYTPIDGTAVAVTVYLVSTSERVEREDGTGVHDTATIMVRTDAAGIDGLPEIGDTITHGSIIWTVRAINWAKHNVAAVDCERQTAKTAHRRGHYLRE